MNLEEIHQRHGQATNRVNELYYGGLADLREDIELTPDERTERAWNIRDAAIELMYTATEQRNAEIEKREGELRRSLFRVPNAIIYPERSAAYTKAIGDAALADDAGLERLHRAAKKTGDSTLARAVASEAHERGRTELLSEYLGAHPEAREAYDELASIPDADARERALDNVRRSIPEPRSEQVQPSAEALAARLCEPPPPSHQQRLRGEE
jgi:hypothetical protein